MELRFDQVPTGPIMDWFVISRVRYMENLVIVNLLENDQSVCYVRVYVNN